MKYLRLLFVSVITGVLVYFFLRNAPVSHVGAILGKLSLLYPALFCFGLLTSLLIRCRRWSILLKTQGGAIPFSSLYRFTMIGYMVSYTLPGRLGEIARPLLLAEKEKLSRSPVLASVVLERLLDGFGVLLILILVLPIQPVRTPLIRHLGTLAIVGLGLMVLLFGVFRFSRISRFRPGLEKGLRVALTPLGARLRDRFCASMIRFAGDLRPGLSRSEWLRFSGWSLALWGSLIFAYWALMRGFGLQASFGATVPFFGIIYLAAGVPTPGMIGGLDAGARLGLAGLFHASAATAVAYTLVFHFLLVGIPVALGLFAFWQEGLSFAKLRIIKTTHEMSRM